MLKIIKKNFNKLSHYPRLRILLIVIVVIVAFIVIMNLLRPANPSASLPSNVQTASPAGSNQRTVSASQTAQYQQLHQVAEQQAQQQAVATGASIFQNAFGPSTQGSETTAVATTKPVNTTQASPTNTQDSALAQQVATLQQQLASAQQQTQNQTPGQASQAPDQGQDQNANLSQYQTQVTSVQTAMNSGIQKLTATWNTPSLQTVSADAPTGSASNGQGSNLQGPVAIKAGTILFGVIDTALDSDQPNTPVLARIVEGPYKGARLLGGFTSTPTALVVQFNTMSLPNGNASFPINAYAVDARTANNSVVTSVDNHYLLRYGMLFASAFLQGFGNAYQNYTYNCPPGTQNCSVVNTNSNGTTNSATTPTTETAMYQGLGQLGTNAGQAAAQEFNTPPTVKVAQGTGIGVLFMADLRIPLNN